jgi:Rrf2 family protein
MLSRTADHALRALLFLARQEDGQPVPADRIAEALGAPRNYLGKTLNVLARRGLLDGVRGPAGGYRLRRTPGRVTVGHVLEALDEGTGSRAICLLGDAACDEREPCPAHDSWTAMLDAAQRPFQATTLADLLAEATEAAPGPRTDA